MDRRKFLEHTALLSVPSLMPKQIDGLVTIPASPVHFVGIGNGACKAIDYLKTKMPDVQVTKAIGLDFSYETGKFYPGAEHPEKILTPLLNVNSTFVIVYCLGGMSNHEVVLDFIKQLQDKERKFKVILQFPFKFEGKRRNKFAVETADKISLITPYRSVHADRCVEGNMLLEYALKYLNDIIYQLIQEEIIE